MNRAQLIRVINVGRAKLGWDDDTYRATLGRFGGRADADGRISLNTLTEPEMNKLLAHMRKSGFSQKPSQRPKNADTSTRRELKKIEALIADAGQGWGYARGVMKRVTKGTKERLEFCSPYELAAIIAALEHNARLRLANELQAVFGDHWSDIAARIAATLFGFDAEHRDITRYAEPMSKALRWWRGELEAACRWPVDIDKPNCCIGCYQIAMTKAGRE